MTTRMLFHTHEFLALLIATLLVFHLVPARRHAALLAASIVFYAYAGLGMLALFIAVSAFAYVCLRRIETGDRRFLAVGAVGILGNLIAFKYTAFLLDALAASGVAGVAPAHDWVTRHVLLPIGISFYSFQLLAVLIDAARGQRLDVRSFRELLLFIMFFGHLIAGPIMRGREFFPQLHELPGPSPSQVRTGVTLLAIGVIKKAVLADLLLTPRSDALFAAAHDLSAPAAWTAALLFGFQIYFDFSGYVDMALGMSKLFGLELMPNFATPYLSRSPSEFWGRWNITLSRWFGDYVYIPLGGSRVTLPRTVVNLLATMALSGLWHGAGWTFLIWGLIHGSFLAAFHVLRRFAIVIPAAPGWALTFAVTTVGWVYFRAPTIADANAIVSSMFGLGGGAVTVPAAASAILVLGMLALHALEAWWLRDRDAHVERAAAVWMRIPGPVQAAIAFPALLALIGLTRVTRGAFIYFQF